MGKQHTQHRTPTEYEVNEFRKIPLKTHHSHHIHAFPDSFTGRKAVKFMQEHFKVTEEDACRFGTLMLQAGVIKSCNYRTTTVFSNGRKYIYAFDEPPENQNLFWLFSDEDDDDEEEDIATLEDMSIDHMSKGAKKAIEENKTKELPSIKRLPIIGNVFSVASFGDTRRNMQRLGREVCPKFDGIFRLNIMNHEYVIVSDPYYADIVFTKFNKKTETDSIFRSLRCFRGEGLTTVGDGPLHAQCQAVVAPNLRSNCFEPYVPIIINTMQESMLELSKLKQPFDVREFWKKAILRSIGRLAMSVDLYDGSKRWKQFTDSITFVNDEAINRVFKASGYQPIRNHKFQKSCNIMHTTILDFVNERKARLEQFPKDEKDYDLLDRMITTPMKEEDGKKIYMSSEIIRANLTTILSAGHSTTTSMLSWTLNFLYDFSLGNSDVRYRLLSEIEKVSKGDRHYKPTLDDVLKKMPFLTNVLLETLRFNPPIPSLIRHCLKTTEIDGYIIRKGETVMISVLGIHLNPKSWDNPLKYDPDRFNNPPEVPCAFIPWASGPRQCIGREVALLTGRISLFMLLNTFSLEMSPTSDVVEDEHLFIFPSGLYMDAMLREVKPVNKDAKEDDKKDDKKSSDKSADKKKDDKKSDNEKSDDDGDEEDKEEDKDDKKEDKGDKKDDEEKDDDDDDDKKDKDKASNDDKEDSKSCKDWRGLKQLIEKKKYKVTVIAGTKTDDGNVHKLAHMFTEKAECFKFQTGDSPITPDEYTKIIKDKPKEFTILVVVTATYNGKPPSNAKKFISFLKKKVEAEDSKYFENVHYFVFGCGNTNWASTYQKIPKYVDESLEKLGGKRIIDLIKWDESKDDMEDTFKEFFLKMAPKLMHSIPEIGDKRLRDVNKKYAGGGGDDDEEEEEDKEEKDKEDDSEKDTKKDTKKDKKKDDDEEDDDDDDKDSKDDEEDEDNDGNDASEAKDKEAKGEKKASKKKENDEDKDDDDGDENEDESKKEDDDEESSKTDKKKKPDKKEDDKDGDAETESKEEKDDDEESESKKGADKDDKAKGDKPAKGKGDEKKEDVKHTAPKPVLQADGSRDLQTSRGPSGCPFSADTAFTGGTPRTTAAAAAVNNKNNNNDGDQGVKDSEDNNNEKDSTAVAKDNKDGEINPPVKHSNDDKYKEEEVSQKKKDDADDVEKEVKEEVENASDDEENFEHEAKLRAQHGSSGISFRFIQHPQEPPAFIPSTVSYKNARKCKVMRVFDLTPDAGRSNFHAEIELPEGMDYETGDHLVVFTKVTEDVAERVLQHFVDYDLDSVVEFTAKFDPKRSKFQLPLSTPMTLRNILCYLVNLKAKPKKQFVINYSVLVEDKTEAIMLAKIVSDQKKFKKWSKKYISIIDIVSKFKPREDKLNRLIEMLPPLKPRVYSITSCPGVHKNVAHICISNVDEEFDNGTHYFGIASSHFKSMVQVPEEIFAMVEKAEDDFRVPKDGSIPIVLISGGTGFAPMRAFIHEREQQKATGMNYVFHGCRSEDTDILYKEELEKWQESGFIKAHFAFSRSQKHEKQYVQDVIKENGDLLWKLIEIEKAHIYLCGSGTGLGAGVHDALKEIVKQHLEVGPKDDADEAATNYLDEMTEDGRYSFDVWG